MNEQDTVEWYMKMLDRAKAAKEEASKPTPPSFQCCGREETKGHHPECVHFQPVGETKKNRIVQHFPSYMDFDAECIGFDTLDELMAIPWVKHFSTLKDFHRFSGGTHLMAEMEDGYSWWAVGRLRYPVDGLPTWEAKYKNQDSRRLTSVYDG